MHYVYILYTVSYDKYYVGETADIETRLRLHREGVFKGASTKFARDWELKFFFQTADRAEAISYDKYYVKS